METDEQYLKTQLYYANLELDDVRIRRRIVTAELNVLEEKLNKQIDSIEHQLGDRKNK